MWSQSRSWYVEDSAVRIGRQDHRRERLLPEVEVAYEVAEQPLVLADVGARVGTAVRPRIQTLAAEEVVLDELQVRVEAVHVVVDVAAPRIRADHHRRHADAV